VLDRVRGIVVADAVLARRSMDLLHGHGDTKKARWWPFRPLAAGRIDSLDECFIRYMILGMNRQEARSYASPLRTEQARATALRIMEAAIRVLERRPAALSIPAVAREAGVSVPTVYHHFGDKAGLISAVSDHLDQSEFLEPPTQPTSPAGLADHVRSVFPRLDGRRALMAPAFRLPEGERVRREQIAERVAMVRTALAPVESEFDPSAFDHLAAIVTVLGTSETVGLLLDHLNLTMTDAAEAVAWAITKLSMEEP
jgi:AcrR family transcriptional regulator